MTRPRIKDFDYISGKKYDGLMGRCYRESDKSYGRYGGRGIKVCSSWIKDINSFREWAKQQLEVQSISVDEFVQSPNLFQLDRVDSDGHYCPDNCRFCSPQDNARNKRNIKRIIVSAEGEEIEL